MKGLACQAFAVKHGGRLSGPLLIGIFQKGTSVDIQAQNEPHTLEKHPDVTERRSHASNDTRKQSRNDTNRGSLGAQPVRRKPCPAVLCHAATNRRPEPPPRHVAYKSHAEDDDVARCDTKSDRKRPPSQTPRGLERFTTKVCGASPSAATSGYSCLRLAVDRGSTSPKAGFSTSAATPSERIPRPPSPPSRQDLPPSTGQLPPCLCPSRRHSPVDAR